MPKINKEGDFTLFSGVTVISSVNINNLLFWKEIYNFLFADLTVKQHYALLPHESYHMTTHNLYTEEFDAPSNWQQFIDENLSFFETISDHLKELKISPEIQIRHVIVDNVIQLIITIPPGEENKIKGLAALFGLENSVPNPFHITLAYQKKELEEFYKKELSLRLVEKINSLSNAGTKLFLNSPTLCYFRDMQEFIRWDGLSNPFRIVKPIYYFNQFIHTYCIIDEVQSFYLIDNNENTFNLYGPEWVEKFAVTKDIIRPRYWAIDINTLIKSQLKNPQIFSNNFLTREPLSIELVRSCLGINPNDKMIYQYNQNSNPYAFNSKKTSNSNAMNLNIKTENLSITQCSTFSGTNS